MTQSRPKKTVSVLLSLALLLSLLGTGVHAAGTAVAQGAYADVYNMISDPDASDASAYFSPSTIENGRLWTDKTVSVGSAPIYDMNGNPLKTLTAPQDQFMVNLSVLSQSYTVDTIVEPSDTVFVLDVSGSMTTVMDNGKTRIEETVAALNTAIGILLDANPDNRVAVVAYGGLQVGTAWQTRTYDILDLDRYDMVTDGNYFYMSAANVVSVSSQITAPTTRSVTVTGGTPTQRGIYAGAQVLMNNGDTAFTTVYPNNPANPLTMTRKPNIILLSDGEPTYGWTDYTMRSPANPNSSWNWGNGSALDLGIDTLTVCTAAYWKQQVSDHYYGTANGGYAGFYTLGLALNSNHALAVLDPLNNARYVTQLYNSVTYNMGAVLGSFVGPAATATFPAVNTNGTSRTSVTITNPGNYISEYAYTDGFYSAQSAAQLESAFKTIAQRIVSRGDYITHVPPNENPDFSGYVNYSDVIGSYMQFKGIQGLWYENNLYDGHVFARDIRTDPALQNEYINDLIKNGLFNLSSTQARSLLTSAIAAGAPDGIFYNSPTDFGNKIKYYGDDSGSYLGSYFDASGNALPAPAGATCIVDLYAMAGKVDNTDPVTTPPTDPTDLMTISFQVITALAAGNFFDNFYDADTSTTGNEFVRSLQTGQQVVRWLIPASLIPLRTISPELDENGSVLRLDIKNTDPMRFIYNVGLQSGFDLSGVDAAYKAANTANTTPAAYSFYTNAWNKGPDSSNLAVAYFQPKATNPYYFYTSADGQVPLYVQDGSGGFTPAVTYVSGTTYYTKDEVFDADYAPTYLRDIFTPVDESVTTISGQDDAPFIDVSGANQQVKPAAFVTELKSPNITETTPYVLNGYAYMPAGIDQYSQINLLGNNGRLDIPFTQLTARKDWDQSIADPQPVYIQLYGTDLNGVPQPVGDPVKFDPSATGTAGLSASAAY
ncbi:MAG: VWA domain-containing protein, partial [Defluviitaleaceae bacterium]|nr:VWA domain-containing protein [Defluviitaleaceae bacterium]